MKRNRRLWLWIGLGLVSVVLLTLVLAPIQGTAQRAGSSYSRAPDGYGAWYHYMKTQPQVCMGRWHYGRSDLPDAGTLVQVFPNLVEAHLSDAEWAWVRQGNTLIRLGVESKIVEAPFSSQVTSLFGLVKVETRRRNHLKPSDQQLDPQRHPLLSDKHGAIVWQVQAGKGNVIMSTTPYLGANAYQNQAGNFTFLAELATPKQGAIWMDETRFGYHPARQIEAQSEEEPIPSRACEALLAQSDPAGQGRSGQASMTTSPPNPILYLLKTPIGLVLLQALLMTLVLIIAQNRRFGLPLPLPNEQSDNTLSYIRALATVLYKARCHGFVVAAIQQAEQRSLQQRLGLGMTLLEPDQVLQTWQQMGYPPDVLNRALIHPPSDRCREQDLLTWLEAWQQVKAKVSHPISSGSL